MYSSCIRSVIIVLAATAFATGGSALLPAAASVPLPGSNFEVPEARPNIVLILADDLDMSLLRTMPNVMSLADHGVSFDNAFVVDSLCCPSRAATLTGMFPHNTEVRTNTSLPDDPTPNGGYAAFRDDEDKTFAVSVQQQGYRTAFMGKYINQYKVYDGGPLPPGWDQWNAVSGGGYQGWKYAMTDTAPDGAGGTVVTSTSYQGLEDDQFVQTVLGQRAVDFISAAAPQSAPYLLEVAPYATHSRVRRPAHPGDPSFPSALQDRPSVSDPDGNCGGEAAGVRDDCALLSVRQLAGFGQATDDNSPYSQDGTTRYPGWLPADVLADPDIRRLTKDYRNRARAAQSVDRIVGDIVGAAQGEPTYVVFTSDNGFRLGQFQLRRGKGSAYTPDISVPLIVGGSAVPVAEQGTSRDQIVMNIDLAPTFEDMAGQAAPTAYRDGQSLVPLITSGTSVPWRTLALIEHVQPPASLDNPDEEVSTNRVPTYWAVRSKAALFVESQLRVTDAFGQPVTESGFEYYTGLSAQGAYEDVNVYSPGDAEMEQMRQALEAYRTCSGADCRSISVS